VTTEAAELSQEQQHGTASPAESLSNLPATAFESDGDTSLRRRITYMMLFRVVLISLVLGATSLLYWLSDEDLTAPNATVIFAIIVATYLLTIVYAVALTRGLNQQRLAYFQLAADLVIASLLIHVTGGAQSAYTFFFPLAVIGGGIVLYREGVLLVALTSALLFVAVSVAGFYQLLPIPDGQRLLPHELEAIQMIRMLGLNLAGIAGVGVLAVNLAGQLERASASLQTERSATANLMSLHEDIVRSLPSGLITVDNDDHVLTINEAACAILNTQSSKVIGSDYQGIMPGLAALLSQTAIVTRGEISLDTEPQHKILGVSISPLFGADRERLGQVINFQDLTEVREMEKNVKQAERLAAVGSLAAGVAHEIRNPLASMSGAVELLREGKPEDDESAKLMGIVTREIDRLNSLIRDFLDYTNPSPPKKLIMDLCDVLNDTVTMFKQDRAFEGVTVESRFETSELVLESDPEKLRQVLWNLLRNAAQAAIEGGKHVDVSLETQGDSVVIAVRDDGPGITEGDMAKIFDPFFTTKSKGSGLGLATAHGIIRDLGGRIEVESRIGRGSTFVVVLPYSGAHEHVSGVRQGSV